jgi:hypothetical protein
VVPGKFGKDGPLSYVDRQPVPGQDGNPSLTPMPADSPTAGFLLSRPLDSAPTQDEQRPLHHPAGECGAEATAGRRAAQDRKGEPVDPRPLAFGLAEVVIIKAIGIGLAIAAAIDATLVRALVVPAVMRLLGDLNWWAPHPLRWLYKRAGMGHVRILPGGAMETEREVA